MKEELQKAEKTADCLMWAILEENADVLLEAFPDETSVWYQECGYNLKEKLHRLRTEIIEASADRDDPPEFRRTGIYSAEEYREEPFAKKPDAPVLKVTYEIGKPFCEGRLAWPFSITLCFLEDAWRLDSDWIFRYLADE